MKPPDKHRTHKHANQSFAGRLSMMLHSKHVATLGHTRQPAASLRITPFKPACSSKHSVCVRAAATDAVEEAPEAVQDEVDIALEPLFIEDVEVRHPLLCRQPAWPMHCNACSHRGATAQAMP